MRFVLKPKATAIAATLVVLSVLLVFNIVTGLNTGPLSATPVHAAGTCAASSASNSSSTSYPATSAGVTAAYDDAKAARSSAAAALDAANNDYQNAYWEKLGLAAQYSNIKSQCSAAQQAMIDGLLSDIGDELSQARAELADAQMQAFNVSDDIVNGLTIWQIGQIAGAITDFQAAISAADDESLSTQLAGCDLALANSNMNAVWALLLECSASSSSSSNSSSNSSGMSSFGMSSSQ